MNTEKSVQILESWRSQARKSYQDELTVLEVEYWSNWDE